MLFKTLQYSCVLFNIFQRIVVFLRADYANEADMLNMALFGTTAKQWRPQNPDAIGNMRDHADIYQLIVLVNLESMNAELIKHGMAQKDRLAYLNNMAIDQMRSLINSAAVQRLDTVIHNTLTLPESKKG